MPGSKSHNQAIDHSQKSTPIVIYLTCSLIATVILLIDIWIPLGVAAGVPYIIVVLISLKSPENRFTIIVALTCTLFVGIGYLASPPAPDYVPFYQIAANRSLSIAAIWVVAIMTLIQRNRNDKLHQMQLRNLESMKEAEIQKEKLKNFESNDAYGTGHYREFFEEPAVLYFYDREKQNLIARFD